MATLDKVLLAPAAVKRWLELCGMEARKGGIAPQDVPDEQAEPQTDGSLLIFCDLPDCRVSMRVPPDEWSWIPQN